MTIRTVQLPGLPAEIEVRRSTRRSRTVGARREGGKTIVTIPNRMSQRDAAKASLELHERLIRRIATRPRPSDDQLRTRAEWLRETYLPTETPRPASVEWSTRQKRRWGSCTPTDLSIRISSRLQNAPEYALDYVLVHELAHLLVANHGPEFRALTDAYPYNERAEAFLAGVEFAAAMDPLVDEAEEN